VWLAGRQLLTLLGVLFSLFKTSAELRLENLALRHQLGVLRRSAPKQLKLTPADRMLWVWLRRVWTEWKSALLIVQPATVIAWHRKVSVCFGVGRSGAASAGVRLCRRKSVI
jgi:putative transposase